MILIIASCTPAQPLLDTQSKLSKERPTPQSASDNRIMGTPIYAPPNGTSFNKFLRADGKVEIYFAAGERNLELGNRFLNDFWNANTNNLRLTQGYWDAYLPIQLRTMNNKPAQAIMRRFANHALVDSIDPITSLVPFSYGGYSSIYRTDLAGKQNIAFTRLASELLSWFPEDATLRQKALANAKNTIHYFDYKNSYGQSLGLYNLVNTKNGMPGSQLTFNYNFGEIAEGIFQIASLTEDTSMNAWADQKLTFEFTQRPNPNLAVLVEQFYPWGFYFQDGPRQLSDTDTLYQVRNLSRIYDITGNRKYLDQALATIQIWYDGAWLSQYGHYARKIRFSDGKAAVENLYGDGKWNVLYALLIGYKATNDIKYINRFKTAWNNYIAKSPNGLVCENYVRGVCENVDSDGTAGSENTMFLHVLVDAYNATRDTMFLTYADKLGQAILAGDASAIRSENGDHGTAFLRLGLAKNKIWRLEADLGGSYIPLKISNSAHIIFNKIVPGDVAVIYLPQGTYNVTINKKIQTVILEHNRNISLATSAQIPMPTLAAGPLRHLHQ